VSLRARLAQKRGETVTVPGVGAISVIKNPLSRAVVPAPWIRRHSFTRLRETASLRASEAIHPQGTVPAGGLLHPTDVRFAMTAERPDFYRRMRLRRVGMRLEIDIGGDGDHLFLALGLYAIRPLRNLIRDGTLLRA
jgi:hypothetical protein